MPPAARVARARDLWASTDASAWRAELAAAPTRRTPTVAPIDDWFYARCGDAVKLNELTASDVSQAVFWKMKRNKFRPRLQQLADSNTEATVAAAAKAADAALGTADVKSDNQLPSLTAVGSAIDALCVLSGIGPATATCLLTIACASIPFFSEEAGAAVLGSYDHKKPDALKLTSALRQKAADLGDGWTARDVERALWSAARRGEGEGGDAKPASKKRKAA